MSHTIDKALIWIARIYALAIALLIIKDYIISPPNFSIYKTAQYLELSCFVFFIIGLLLGWFKHLYGSILIVIGLIFYNIVEFYCKNKFVETSFYFIMLPSAIMYFLLWKIKNYNFGINKNAKNT